MGQVWKRFLADKKCIYVCANCKTHLSTYSLIVSTTFTGLSGNAILFSSAVNFRQGDAADRRLATGLHTVRDVYCIDCNAKIGWRYELAYAEDQKYKEGKVVLECAFLREKKE